MDNLKEISENVKNSLTIEQVKDLLFALGGDPQIKENIVISRTICHGGQSHKLYYYDNTKLFKCYTDCPEASFDIYELIIKINKISLFEAIKFIINFYGIAISASNFIYDNSETNDWQILSKYEQNTSQEKEEKRIELKYYDDKILKYLPHPKIPMWLNEGISQEVMDLAYIKFDPVC